MPTQDEKIKNILLLSVEDLNDWIEPLGGHPQTLTPNFNRLANRSTVFENAFAAAPACSPSRTSTLFGQAPWRTGMYSNRQSWGLTYPAGDRRSVVGQARDAGWETIGAGKVFHMGPSGLDLADWSKYFHTEVDTFSRLSTVAKQGLVGPLTDFGPIPDDSPPQSDERNSAFIQSKMNHGDKGKFWAFGTFSPHLPFVARQEFFNKIKGPIEVPPSFHGKAFDPHDLSEFSKLSLSARKLAHRQIGRSLHETGEYLDFVHSYLASISYADFVVGQILDRLQSEGLLDSTLIIFWSDHGLQFGEKLAFHKFTLWERALRVPLFISHPNLPANRISEPVSLLDIYPTISKLLKLDSPHPYDGQDLLPLLKGEKGRALAVSMWERYEENPPHESHMATTVRTEEYRLIQYDIGFIELYDHRNDPFEKINLADKDHHSTPNLEQICYELMQHLPQNMAEPLSRSALPKNMETRLARVSGKKLIF